MKLDSELSFGCAVCLVLLRIKIYDIAPEWFRCYRGLKCSLGKNFSHCSAQACHRRLWLGWKGGQRGEEPHLLFGSLRNHLNAHLPSKNAEKTFFPATKAYWATIPFWSWVRRGMESRVAFNAQEKCRQVKKPQKSFLLPAFVMTQLSLYIFSRA